MITARNLSNGTNIERYTVAEMRETLTELSRENCDAVKIYYKDGSLACFYGDDYDPRDLREALSKTGIRSIIQEGGWYIWYTGSAKNILIPRPRPRRCPRSADLAGSWLPRWSYWS